MKRALLLLSCLLLAACAGQAPRRTLPPAAATLVPPAPPRGEPQGYTGLGANQLRAAFGPPVFQRNDGATQMWRYDGTGCKAFFFLYGNAGQEQVRHVETLPRGAQSAADPACLSALRKPVS